MLSSMPGSEYILNKQPLLLELPADITETQPTFLEHTEFFQCQMDGAYSISYLLYEF